MGLFSDSVAMMRVKWQMRSVKIQVPPEETDLRFCYDIMNDVSRSFAVVVAQLADQQLRDAICIFYLVLRALDTLEDDMSVPVDVKLKELPKFHTHTSDMSWCMSGVGEGRERELLEKYPCVSRAFKKLKKGYQDVIANICERMANGMCEFLKRPVVTKDDYNEYCHYVAGLVGHGLTQLFARCGFEDPSLDDDLTSSNHMGLFLQKTNIIRDYYEDIREEPPRMFWPKEIWGTYVTELKELKSESNNAAAVQCLNAMVADALVHVPYIVDYLSALRDPSVFRFCAIPQVMAIATLKEVYNNPDTFQVKVKVSRPESCRIMLKATTLYSSLSMLRDYCVELQEKLDMQDASSTSIANSLAAAIERIDLQLKKCQAVSYTRSLLARYPGLGGQFLLTVMDTVAGFFGGRKGIADHA
ncbi:putative farnesyltransferase [Leishmania infantum JPCM5]|uniref:Squalene synthase n=2 Tax=Leishmania infantum TaxID=5671 RepID=A0A6L0XL50_LEIIN|nr:putative farnesyltransferase [Leishmania infantum JPCM5]CAC9521585.1 squalene_synthase_-_putative [Leishmania infantum]CAM70682.1 putative farnesyltransferase [Leishmania infantum JPCM5]SUZ44535.1 squalene_synthase_-_putative [Leishmania infantum]|eukprot:XP_001467618.1 putative farnesyltransferase [Leishmania infantum JPCM5]